MKIVENGLCPIECRLMHYYIGVCFMFLFFFLLFVFFVCVCYEYIFSSVGPLYVCVCANKRPTNCLLVFAHPRIGKTLNMYIYTQN